MNKQSLNCLRWQNAENATEEFKAAYDKFMETKEDTRANAPAAKALIAELEKAAENGCEDAKEVLTKKQYLAKNLYGSLVETVGLMTSVSVD